ncbi:mitochondrial 54S ribosomal protein mL44 [Kwoniella dejecticola CBS 10117]|uniref:Large ribosomal subunit protein mL44 n=1 Tax=Kwoniella dejecticola CBS 10117 TaxID=1296121 RepID=A0A1A6AGX1_9TREE|nr:uncharacterized protein I303_01156 [Kwoniella dejecticola CBS 10117]OBR89330.1 hypothetical protein I303_01156 [Kwoniella dejecticola CBS 10117]
MSSLARPAFPPSLARRIAIAKRRSLPSRTLHTSSPSLSIAPRPEPSSIPPPTAISALLSRLSLPSNDTSLHSKLVECLTHPSYYAAKAQLTDSEGEVEELEIVNDPSSSSSSHTSSSSTSLNATRTQGDNELLANLGNSLLGLYASEYITQLYPYLPTQAIKNAITAYVGPSSCLSVGRELGVSVQGGGNNGSIPGQGKGSNSSGLPIRWSRTFIDQQNYLENYKGENIPSKGPERPETVPVARRFQKFLNKNKDSDAEIDTDVASQEGPGYKKGMREKFEDVVAATVRSFVGLIYQEQGIHAAREFVHAHFLSRSIDLSELFNFKNPLHMLSSVISSHLSSAGVPISANQGVIEKRLLASTGVNSQSPLFLIGLFLPSGIKLAEGHGSSKAMAEYRAAKNALLSLYLVRSDSSSSSAASALKDGYGNGSGSGNILSDLPSAVYSTNQFLRNGKLAETQGASGSQLEREYKGPNWGGKDVVAESRDKKKRTL